MESPNEIHRRIPTRYREARFVIGVVDFFALIVALAGFAWLGWSVFGLGELGYATIVEDEPSPFSIMSLFGVGSSLALIVSGFLIFANGQLVRASLDNADLARETFVLIERGQPRN